jgi:hypothetical protein
VQNALDANRGNGRSFDRRKQNATKRVSNCGSESPLERLSVKLAVFIGERVGVGCKPLWFLKSLPEHVRFYPFL